MTSLVFIGLGASIGPKPGNPSAVTAQNQKPAQWRLEQALELLAQTHAVQLVEKSAYYQTRAWGQQRAGAYLNAAACLQTTWLPVQVLGKLLDIERLLGRRRGRKRWGPRAIDLDMLLYAQADIRHAQLQIPHPWMWQRQFVLAPLSDLAHHLCAPQRLQLQRALFEYNGHILTRPQPLAVPGNRQPPPLI